MSETAAARPLKRDHVFDRAEHDWYQEPSWVTTALLSVERFVGPCLDPACGGGNIVEALMASGIHARGTDIITRTGADWFLGEADFLSAYVAKDAFPNIVCNPPYKGGKGSEAFIRKALSLASGKVAMFVDIRFLAGATRANGLFAEHPPTRIWIVTPRPSCPPGAWLAQGNKAGGGTADYCWIVYDLTSPQTTTQFGWLRSKTKDRAA